MRWLGMTKINPFLPAALLSFGLIACQQADPNNIAIDEVNNAAAMEVETLPPSDTASTNIDGAAPSENAATPSTLPTSIPAQFHGRWGINRADCTSTKGDAKSLLTINDARLTFYEAKGTLDKVLGATATSFDASYGFMGEGQTWQRVERLKLVNDRLQRRTDAAPGQEPPVNLTYLRCGA